MKSAAAEDAFGLHDIDGDDEDGFGGSSDEDSDGGDGGQRQRVMSVHTGMLEEKAEAVRVLGIMALHLGPSFVSYLQPAVETVQSCSQYFHEDVRAAAILSTVQLAASFAVSAVTPQSTGAVTVPQGWAAAAAQAATSTHCDDNSAPTGVRGRSKKGDTKNIKAFVSGVTHSGDSGLQVCMLPSI